MVEALIGGLQELLDEAEAEANRLVEAGDVSEAASKYEKCASLARQIADGTSSPRLRQQRLARSASYKARADALKVGKLKGRGKQGESRTDDDSVYEGEIQARVQALITDTTVDWDDVAGQEEAKSDIRYLLAVSLCRKPEGVDLGKRPNILLFGPPGTGKTLLAAAAAHGLGQTFYNVKAGDLLSKWFGESPQLIATLFREARATAPSVVFIDEFEALTKDRELAGGLSGAEGRVLAALLSELDGIDTKNDDALVMTIAATNKPALLDEAIISRFSMAIEIGLPEHEERMKIFELNIDSLGLHAEIPSETLAELAERLSGRDIAQICREARRSMIRRCNPELEDLIQEGPDAVESYKLKLVPIKLTEFEDAVKRIRMGVKIT